MQLSDSVDAFDQDFNIYEHHYSVNVSDVAKRIILCNHKISHKCHLPFCSQYLALFGILMIAGRCGDIRKEDFLGTEAQEN